MWKAVDDLVISHEASFTKEARTQFEADKRAVLALVTDAKQKALQRKASIDWLELEESINKYIFDSSVVDWRERFAPVMTAVVEDVGNYWSAQTGFAWNVRNLMAESWFSEYQLTFSNAIGSTTSDTIHDILAQGMAEGWSIPEMQAHLTQTFQQWMVGGANSEDFDWLQRAMPPYRTELIARVETMRSSNAGATALFKSWEIEQKEWLSTRDDRTRDAHLLADGQIKPMDDPFILSTGVQLMYPLDMSLGAPANQVMNCRCSVLPVIN